MAEHSHRQGILLVALFPTFQRRSLLLRTVSPSKPAARTFHKQQCVGFVTSLCHHLQLDCAPVLFDASRLRKPVELIFDTLATLPLYRNLQAYRLVCAYG